MKTITITIDADGQTKVEAAGFHKHKCATIAEAEMIAQAGGGDVLLL